MPTAEVRHSFAHRDGSETNSPRGYLSYVSRTMPLLPLAVAGSLSTLIVAWQHGNSDPGPLLIVAYLLAGGAGFVLDDPAAEILSSSPTSLLRRRVARLLLVLPPVALLWALLLWWFGPGSSNEAVALTQVAVGLLVLGQAVAVIAAHISGHHSGGIAVLPTLFALSVLSSALPPEVRPLPFGDLPGGWTQIHIRWTVVAVIGALLLVAFSRDRAAQGVRSMRPRLLKL